jgi:hypothetical protein
MNEYRNGGRASSDVTEDILCSTARGYHLERFGEELVLAANDKHFLVKWLTSDSEKMQIFVLCHLVAWKFDDDIMFINFSIYCLKSESSLDLKIAAIMYLNRVFGETANYELLRFLRRVLSETLDSARTLPPSESAVATKIAKFLYASIMIDLDYGSEISPDLVLDGHALDKLDRALDSGTGDAEEAERSGPR